MPWLTGNCLRPLCMANIDKHFGAPVFFSVLSRAQALSTGSFDRSSEIDTSSAVSSTCFICVIVPVSCAFQVRTTLNACERIRIWPSLLPMKRLSDPEHTQLNSLLLPCQLGVRWLGILLTDIKCSRVLFVPWQLYLGNIEEIKHFPLFMLISLIHIIISSLSSTN